MSKIITYPVYFDAQSFGQVFSRLDGDYQEVQVFGDGREEKSGFKHNGGMYRSFETTFPIISKEEALSRLDKAPHPDDERQAQAASRNQATLSTPNPPHGSSNKAIADIISVLSKPNPSECDYDAALKGIRNLNRDTRNWIHRLCAIEGMCDDAEEKILDAKYARLQ